MMDTVYAFRIGDRYWPKGISAPFSTLADARHSAQTQRLIGYDTGRVHKMTSAQYDEHASNLRRGILSI